LKRPENYEQRRTLTSKELKKIHSYGFNAIIFRALIVLMSLFSLIISVFAALNYLSKGEGNWIFILLAVLFFSGVLVSFIFSILDVFPYSKVKINEKVHMIEDKIYYKYLGRSGEHSFIGSMPVKFLPEFMGRIRRLKWGTIIKVEAIKVRKKYLVIKVIDTEDKN
jgi:hypothetical protein